MKNKMFDLVKKRLKMCGWCGNDIDKPGLKIGKTECKHEPIEQEEREQMLHDD